MEEAAKGALRRPDRAHGTAGKSGRKSARPGSACLHCLSLHGSVAPTYSGVLPTRAAVQCRRSSSAPPPAPPAPSCPLPPAAAPPSPPRPLIPPGLPPPSVFVGEKGGRSRGVRSGFPALGRAGGRFRRLRYGPAHVRHTWARLPAWLYKPCATLSRRFLLSEERPVRRAPAGRNATRSVRAELLERPFATNGQQHSGTPGNGIPVGQARKKPRLPKRLPRK